MSSKPRRVFLLLLLFLVGGSLLVVALLRWRLVDRASPSTADFAHSKAWLPLGGDWTANQDEIQNASQERGAKLITRMGAWSDYQVQADLDITEPYGEAGLILRSNGEEEGVDAYHGYFAGISTMDSSMKFGRADFGWHSLIHRSLSASTFHGPVHLRVVAVGCSFGIVVTTRGGHATAATTQDPGCIESGHIGLRSSLTSATWTHLEVSRATANDLAAIQQQVTESPVLSPFEPDPAETSSLIAEASLHQLRHDVQPIISFLMAPGRHPNVTIQGVVISAPPLTDIQDDTGALIVPHVDPRIPLKVGDVVEAAGTVISDRFRSQLEDATIKVLWSDTAVPPLAVGASQLNSGTYRGRSIEVEGILRSVKLQPVGYDLVLEAQGQTFRALSFKKFQVDSNALRVGSRLRLRGMATSLSTFTAGIYPFAIITEHIDVVSSPPWWSLRNLTLLAITCACLLMFAQFLLHRLQRWRIQSVLRERELLAFEMHDTLAQSFTGIAFQLRAASTERRGEKVVQEHLANAIEMVRISHREASRTIAALRPQYRDSGGILSALKEAAERLCDGGTMTIKTIAEGRTMHLPLDVTDAFFRIGQEAVTNAIQHSGCKSLRISLKLDRRESRLSVTDNGCGMVQQQVSHGLGMDGMQRRAAKINARLDITTGPDQGTTVSVYLPRPAARGWLGRVWRRIT